MRLLFTSIKLLLALSLAWTSPSFAENAWVHVSNGHWIPEPSALADLKAHIESYSTSSARKQKRELRNWSEYVFQYQGQEEKGAKFILVNALCHKDPRWNLEREFIRVLDGGACFFNLKYDPGLRRYFDLRINAEA